jgi:hypothetical protein
MVARLVCWLKPIIIIASIFGLLFMYEGQIVAISPKLPGASGQPIAMFSPFTTSGTMLLWGASFCIIRAQQGQAAHIRYILLAGFLVAFALTVLQQRTTYMQLLALVGLMLVLRPRAIRWLGVTIPLLIASLIVIAAFDLEVSGRLTKQVSLSFFWDHILSIFGIGQGDLAPSADGVDLRLGWWTRVYDRLTADSVTLITGLGYGIPLTNFSDVLGVTTREPHNSVISVTARLGLIGIAAWLWMQIELFRAAFRAYRECMRTRRREVADFILLCLAFVVLSIGSCFGEDTFEKPYNTIPCYALWGFVLRIAYELRTEPLRGSSAYRAPQVAAISRSSLP